ncbi:tripartite motif-containing protein 2-like [Lytechinus variegatus]|uniref:tripartite motif-containing protein 2-like n=1 Tax=Lytechinus variegatus TaxID=7654 RepID=UPI001BB14156|nr:tripartite motif-containing protein 2-like [Lytechinus variegatus]
MATLNTFLDSVISDEVECAICLSMLERPRILECLHSFCEKCLEKYLKSSKDDSSRSGKSNLKCAICCAHTTIPENGVHGLKLDYRATRLVEALREKETRKSKLVNSGNHCEVCGWTASVKASSTKDSTFTFCSDCCQVLCKRCTTAHAGLRLTKTHEVAKISDLLAGKVTIKNKNHQMHCPKHVDEKLKIFCVTCLEPVCQDCTLSDHAQGDHKLKLLRDYVETIREELSSRQEMVSKKYDEFTDFLNSVQKLRNDITDNAKKKSKAMEKDYTELNRRVRMTQLQMEKEAQDILADQENQLNQLMRKTEHMRSLADKSLSMSRKLLENKEDLVGLSSMYKDLNQAMDRTIADKPDTDQFQQIKESIDDLHYHAKTIEAKIGKVVMNCGCRERSTLTVTCNDGPIDVQFSRDGRISAIVHAEGITNEFMTLYKRLAGYYNQQQQYEYTPCRKTAVSTAIRQTATSLPHCNDFSWVRFLDLIYKSIRCFSSFSDQRFIIATTDAKLYILGDKLDQIDGNLPNGRNISGLTTDSADNIYITDRDNHKIYVVRSSGTLKDTIDVKDISPTCIAVPHIEPDLIAVLHEPATVSILDQSGKALRSIHDDEWKEVAIGCDADRLLYVLWSDEDRKRTLERYSFQGLKVDTLFQGESHSCNSLILAVQPTGDSVAAVVITKTINSFFDGTGEIMIVTPNMPKDSKAN